MHDVPQSPIDDEIDNVLAGQGQALMAASFAYWQHKRMYPERGIKGSSLGVVKAILESMKNRLHDQTPSMEPDDPIGRDVIDVEVIDIDVDRPQTEVVDMNAMDVHHVSELEPPIPEDPKRHDDAPGFGGPPDSPTKPSEPDYPGDDRRPVEPQLFDLIDPSPRGYTSPHPGGKSRHAPFSPSPGYGQAAVKEMPWRGR